MKLLTCFLSAIVLLACNQPESIPEDFDYGKIENGVYRNEYFKFTIPVPESWELQSKEQIEEIRKRGREIVAERNKDLAERVRASEVRSATLLTIFRYPPDSAQEGFNPSLILLAENIKGGKNIKKGADYLEQAKSHMLQSGMGFKISPEYASEKLGGRNFDLMETKNNYDGMEDVTQLYYATIDGDFALVALISFTTAEHEAELKEILHKIKFQED